MSVNKYDFNEKKFVNYFTASILHRGMAMRWIDQRIADIVSEGSFKQAILHFGDIIFSRDKRVTSFKEMKNALSFVSKSSLEGYKRPVFQKTKI